MIKKLTPIVAITLLLSGVFSNPSLARESLTPLTKQPAAPDFKLPDMDGEMFTMQQYRGKPVIVNFWATWCPPCREELPSMNRAWEKVKDQGIEMLAINVGEDEETIFRFMADYPIDFQVLLDETSNATQKWPMKGLPTTFVIDPQGKIVYRAIGGREWDADKLLDPVRALRN